MSDPGSDHFDCPVCGGFLFRPGPRGGLAQNFECVGCEARFNVAFWQRQLMFFQRITNNKNEWREDFFRRCCSDAAR